MSKVICNICGTSYPDSSNQCPICGCVRPVGAAAATVDEPKPESSGGYSYVKGGRFSKTNVRKRNQGVAPVRVSSGAKPSPASKPAPKTTQASRTASRSNPRAKKPADNKMVGFIIAIVIVIVVLAILLLLLWPVLFPGKNADGDSSKDPSQNTSQDGTTKPGDGEGVPCVSIWLSHRSFTIDKADTSLKLEAVPTPSDTTDKLEFISSDPNVVAVDTKGNISFVGNGTADIIVKCGAVTDKCTITCNVPDANPTEPTPTEPEPTDPTEVLELDTAVIQLTAEDLLNPEKITHKVYSGDIPMNEIRWTSDDPTIATFKDGVIEVFAEGITKVRATYGDQEKTCLVAVGTDKGKVSLEGFQAYLVRDGKLVTKVYYFTIEPAYDYASMDIQLSPADAGCDIALVYEGHIFYLEWTGRSTNSRVHYDTDLNQIVVPETKEGRWPEYDATFGGNKIKATLRY